jgi:hypothetical protein
LKLSGPLQSRSFKPKKGPFYKCCIMQEAGMEKGALLPFKDATKAPGPRACHFVFIALPARMSRTGEARQKIAWGRGRQQMVQGKFAQ